MSARISNAAIDKPMEIIPMVVSSVKTKHTYQVADFAAEVEAVVCREREQARIIAQLEPLLARFLAAGTLPEQYCLPVPGRLATEHQGFTLYRLHRGTDDRFNIMVAIWPPGGGTGVHDHAGNWVVEGVYRNCLHTIRYTRQDDGSRAGHAELRQTMALDLNPGEVAHVKYPDAAIHDFINRSTQATVSVHIYGGDITQETLNYFDPATHTVQAVAHDLSYDNE